MILIKITRKYADKSSFGALRCGKSEEKNK